MPPCSGRAHRRRGARGPGGLRALLAQFAPRVYGLCLRITDKREAAEGLFTRNPSLPHGARWGPSEAQPISTWLHARVHQVSHAPGPARPVCEVPEPRSRSADVADVAGEGGRSIGACDRGAAEGARQCARTGGYLWCK